MTINRNEHQSFGKSGIEFRSFVQIHEAVFGKIWNVFCALLERRRHFIREFLMPGGLADLFPERVVAVMGVGRQNKYGNRISFVEPQQNRALKLAYCRSFLVRDIKSWAKTWFRLRAFVAAHLDQISALALNTRGVSDGNPTATVMILAIHGAVGFP